MLVVLQDYLKGANVQRISIYVATHKEIDFELPSNRSIVQVNCANAQELNQAYLKDNDGIDEISRKNESYCEMTVHYQLWKNCSADIKGLEHYRRYFSNDTSIPIYPQKEIPVHRLGHAILLEEQILADLDSHDLILTYDICPFPFTAFEDLQRFCSIEDTIELIKCIESEYPEYLQSLIEVLSSYNLSYRNMLIAKSDVFDDYSSWVFGALNSIEERIDISTYDSQHKRIFGYFAEVLLNVYVRKHCLNAKHYQVAFPLEDTSIIRLRKSLKDRIVRGLIRIGLTQPSYKLKYLSSRYKHYCAQFGDKRAIANGISDCRSIYDYHIQCGAIACKIIDDCTIVATHVRPELIMDVVIIVWHGAFDCDSILHRKNQLKEQLSSKNTLIFRLVSYSEEAKSIKMKRIFMLNGISLIHIDELKAL